MLMPSRTSVLAISCAALLAGTSAFVWAQENNEPPQPTPVETPAKETVPETTDKTEKKEPVKSQAELDDETYRQLNLFGEVFERVRAQYVDQETDKKLIENAINGMLTALDPHSSYLNDDDFKDMQVQTRGEFGGLGIEVTQDQGLVKVVTPIDDTPAARAGLKPGDLITHLDGKPLIGITLSDAVGMMRGKVGSDITLTIRREGASDPLKFSMKRDVIKIQSVKNKTLDDVGYIRITSFNDNTDTGLTKAIADIKKQTGPKLKGYVLDLRNNPGGLLEQAISVSDAFLDSGEIVSTRGRNDQDARRDNATPGDLADGLPIVILINDGTASAAEIVSGALQDHHRAVIMGTQSFGKGSVQTVIPLPGNGAMKLTTARYYTPSGRSIQAKGIEPDIIVKPAKIEEIEGGDHYKESDLKGALANPDKKNESTDSVASSKPVETEKVTDTKDETKNDYQLQRGLDLIRGIALYEAHPTLMSSAAQKDRDIVAATKIPTPADAPAPNQKEQETAPTSAPKKTP